MRIVVNKKKTCKMSTTSVEPSRGRKKQNKAV